ncbi:MAG: IS66 family insertion sequence element accessory protein TnpB [Microscillaceae bacterium]|nr:IS66 family insertion sequence element accessory protein TnpB [Microscillaceae bacterium]
MFSLHSEHRYYLYTPACDMRRNFDSLCGLVRSALGKDPTDGSVYLFLNRQRSHLKLLHWEAGGFVPYFKRLEQGSFHLPEKRNQTGQLFGSELVMMVAGIEVQSSRQRKRYELKKS